MDKNTKLLIVRDTYSSPALLHSDKVDFMLTDIIFLKKENSYHKVFLADIQYIEANGRYTNIITGKDLYTSKHSLSELIRLIDSSDFIKIHRSHIVNVRHVTAYDPSDSALHLHSGKQLSLGRKYKDTFLKRIRLG